ncbi:DUF402 domain-containing protein [Thermodesulfobacteriota bacterium]
MTKFFVDHGLRIVSPSPAIADRFDKGRVIISDGPVDLEINDRQDRQGILLAGKPAQAEPVAALIRNAFPDAICRRGTLDQGDTIDIEFPYLSKASLDELRNRVVPTLPNHHRLRIIASDAVDEIEKNELIYDPTNSDTISRSLEKRLIWDTYYAGKEIAIDHVKLDGRLISLSEGEIAEIHPAEKKLVLERKKFKGRSRYDGLNIPKDVGDYAVTEVREGGWFYRHTYFRRDGEWIGTYCNINTPVEFYPDKIRYVDLEIDVVKRPDGLVEIIDEELLDRHLTAGRITLELKQSALNTARELKTLLLSQDTLSQKRFHTEAQRAQRKKFYQNS